jgi:hypothetical protein
VQPIATIEELVIEFDEAKLYLSFSERNVGHSMEKAA